MANISSFVNNQRPYWLQFVFTGQAFDLAHRFTILAGATAFHQFKTGNTIAHIISTFTSWQGNNVGPLTRDILENPTITDGTTPPQLSANLDRRSSKVGQAQYFVDPTGVSGGTLVSRNVVHGGENKVSVAPAGAVFELVLKPNTDYAIRFINETGADADVFFQWQCYESGN